MSNAGLHALALVGDTPFTSPFTESDFGMPDPTYKKHSS